MAAAMSIRIASVIAESPTLKVKKRRVAEPDVDEVDDVAEAQPVDQVADRAAEQETERERQVQAPPGSRVVADDQRHDDERHDPEHERVVAEQAEQRAGVLAEDRAGRSRR